MRILKTILNLVVGLLIGLAAGFLIAFLIIVLFTDMDAATFLSKMTKITTSEGIAAGGVGILSAVVAVIILIPLHESGHLLFGLLSGYRFVSFRIFNLTFIRINGKLRMKHFAVAGTGGQCLLTPPDLPLQQIPVVMYNLGGILLNVAALLLVLPLLWCHLHPFMHEFVVIFMLVDVFIILMNGIPMRIGGISNDAHNALALRHDEKSNLGIVRMLRSNALIQEGVRPKDMPDEWFESIGDINYKNGLQVSVPLMEASRLIDEMRWDEAYDKFKELYSHKDEIMQLYVKEIACELIFTSLVTDRIEEARMLFDKGMKTYIEAYRKVSSAKERILCTVALIMDNDSDKAFAIYENVARRKNQYLLKGEVKSDLAVMEKLLNL